MTSIVLDWHSFHVDLPTINQYFRDNLGSNYDGLQCTPENLCVAFKAALSEEEQSAVQSYWDSLVP